MLTVGDASIMTVAAEELAEAFHDLIKEFSGRSGFRVELRKGEKHIIAYLGVGPCRKLLRVRPLYEPFIRIELSTLRRAIAPDTFAEQLTELSKVQGFRWVKEKITPQSLTFTRKNLELILADEKPEIKETRDGLRKWLIGLSRILRSVE